MIRWYAMSFCILSDRPPDGFSRESGGVWLRLLKCSDDSLVPRYCFLCNSGERTGCGCAYGQTFSGSMETDLVRVAPGLRRGLKAVRGEASVGRILYQAKGHMSAQLIAPSTASFDSNDPLRATSDEAVTAWRNYIGYWGTYSVDAKARTITHQIEGSWFPNWIGQKQIRSFRFMDNRRLMLEADSPAWHATLIWERID